VFVDTWKNLFQHWLKWNFLLADLRWEPLAFKFSQKFVIEATKHYLKL
jgi:hypothetical protein